MNENHKEFVPVKCPFKRRTKKNNELYICNRTCVKVAPGSSGEARCRTCGLSFEFSVDSQARNITGVRVMGDLAR
jgi:hypothetical protein